MSTQNSVNIGNHYIYAPGSWNDLSAKQAASVSQILHSGMQKDEARSRILIILLKLYKRFTFCMKMFFQLSAQTRKDCIIEWKPITNFIFEKECDLTINKFPSIKINRTRYYGPLDKCKKLVLIEFVKAETYYHQFYNNFDNLQIREEALDKLIATLYRTKCEAVDLQTWNGDIRHEYNDDLIGRTYRVFRKIKPGIRYAILMFYVGSRKRLLQQYEEIFTTSENESSGSGGGWIDAIMQMAGGAMHFKKLAMVDVDIALYDLNANIKKSRKK